MTWKRSEGLRRALGVMQTIELNDISGAQQLDQVVRHHMVNIIAGALEEAYEDGLKDMAKETNTKPQATNGAYSAHFDGSKWEPENFPTLPFTTTADPLPPATADPVGPEPGWLERTMNELDAIADVALPLPYLDPAKAKPEGTVVVNHVAQPPRSRGRPKGAKNKKKAKGKAKGNSEATPPAPDAA